MAADFKKKNYDFLRQDVHEHVCIGRLGDGTRDGRFLEWDGQIIFFGNLSFHQKAFCWLRFNVKVEHQQSFLFPQFLLTL